MYEAMCELRPSINIVYDFYYKDHAREFKRRYPEADSPYSVFEESVYSKWQGTASDWREVEEFEERYEIPLGQAIIGDVYHEIFGALPHSKHTNLEWYRRYVLICFNYFEEILKAQAIDAVVYEAPNSVPTRVLHSVAKQMGIPTISLYASLFENRMWFGMGQSARNVLLDHYFAEAPELLTEEDYERGDAYISRIRDEGRMAYYVAGRNLAPRLRPRLRWLSIPVRVVEEYVRELIQRKRSAEDWIVRQHVSWKAPERFRIRRALTRRRNAQFVCRHWCAPNLHEEYVVFFLQMQPEVTTLGWAPFCMEQAELVKKIAISLPGRFWLYVKEHPADLGSRGRGFYEDLLKFPNVRFIEAFANSIDLIRRASVVCTITGTPGIEAIVLGKPVVVFGDCYYDGFPGVWKVKNPEDLPYTIRQCTNYTPDPVLIRRFAAAYAKSTFEGNLSVSNAGDVEEIASVENAISVTRSILWYLDWLRASEGKRGKEPQSTIACRVAG